jgi:hypothetical protein
MCVLIVHFDHLDETHQTSLIRILTYTSQNSSPLSYRVCSGLIRVVDDLASVLDMIQSQKRMTIPAQTVTTA